MLIQVKATQFCFVRNAKPQGDIYHLEYHEHCESGERIASDNAEALRAELTESAAEEKTVTRGAERRLTKYADGERAPDAA